MTSDKRTATHQAIPSNPGPAKNGRSHTDEAALPDSAAMDNTAMAYGNLFSDERGKAPVGMHSAAVLYIAFPTDGKEFNIASESHIEPNAGILVKNHMADNISTWSNEDALSLEFGRYPLEFIDHMIILPQQRFDCPIRHKIGRLETAAVGDVFVGASL